MGYVFRKIEYVRGRIEVPHLGALVGNIASGTLTRRGDEKPESEFYDFRAVCSWITAAMFNDDDYQKRIVVQIGKNGRQYELKPGEGPGQRTVLSGRNLVMERIKLWPLDA